MKTTINLKKEGRGEMKYQVRRLIVAIFIVGFMTILTSVILQKGIDGELDRRDAVMVEHQLMLERTKEK